MGGTGGGLGVGWGGVLGEGGEQQQGEQQGYWECAGHLDKGLLIFGYTFIGCYWDSRMADGIMDRKEFLKNDGLSLEYRYSNNQVVIANF